MHFNAPRRFSWVITWYRFPLNLTAWNLTCVAMSAMPATGRICSRALAALAAFAWSSVMVRADDAFPALSQPVVRAVTRRPAAPAPQKKEMATLRSGKQSQRSQIAKSPQPQRAKSKVSRTAGQASRGTRTSTSPQPAALGVLGITAGAARIEPRDSFARRAARRRGLRAPSSWPGHRPKLRGDTGSGLNRRQAGARAA